MRTNNTTATTTIKPILRIAIILQILIQTIALNACSSGDDGGGSPPEVSSSSEDANNPGSSSSSPESSSSDGGLCTGFADGTAREHYGKNKLQFCDERDGQKYVYVTIGEGETAQTWMAENLNYAAEESKCYDDDPDNCEKYGRLYDWATAMNGAESSNTNPSGVQGICPEGWHIPSSAEFGSLYSYISNVATKLKANSGWNDNEEQPGNGTDELGFAALPGGYGESEGNSDIDFVYIGDYGEWWNATEYDGYTEYAWNRSLRYNSESTYFGSHLKTYLLSVRCVKD